jgi:hypothetical protein
VNDLFTLIALHINFINIEVNNVFKTNNKVFKNTYTPKWSKNFDICFHLSSVHFDFNVWYNNVKHAHVFDNEVKIPLPQRHWQ